MATTTFRRLIGLRSVFLCVSLLLAGAGETQTFFTDVTEDIAPSTVLSRSVAFGDYDNDGWPDLFLPEWSMSALSENFLLLLHNLGNGRFEQSSSIVQRFGSQVKAGGGALFGDYDNDGDLDLFTGTAGTRAGGRWPVACTHIGCGPEKGGWRRANCSC